MLPQRRKTAEEIAKLRESMGIPGAEPPPPEAEETVSTPEPRSQPDPEPEPVAPKIPAKAVRSLRKSERVPLEREPVAHAVAVVRADAAPIPVRRRSDRELLEMRRIQATPPDKAITQIQQLAVPWPWVLLAYLLPLGGALIGWLAVWSPTVMEPDFPAMWMADLSRKPWLGTAGFWLLVAGCAGGLAMSAWFALKKPRSRHHAGFITIIAVLVAVFGIIHQYAPTHGP